ncbi:MAG: extracellular solute-binding protein [Clostridia bacterium]|nr:extracellular solute-binding protein [Clostridia bacterium]
MKPMTRRVCLLLCLITLLGMMLSAAACGKSDGREAQTTTVADAAATTTAATEATEVTTTEAADAYIYPEVNYGGADFVILNAKDRYAMLYQLMPTELNGESLSDARYQLNAEISERYGITLKETQIDYNDLLPFAQKEVLSGTPEHDIFYLSPKQIASLMNAGYMYNLLDVEKLNMEGEWWDRNLIETGTLKDQYLFYLGGNYHLQGFEGTTCVFFNKEMIANLKLENPYDIVREGKWTFDKMCELASTAVSLNGDDSFSYSSNGKSVYGIATITNMMPAFIMGCDAYYVEKDENGAPILGFTTEHFQNVCSKIATLTSSQGLYKSKDEVALFMANRALMIGAEIKAAANEMRDMQTEFGMLPVPKYDEAQENYVTNMYWATHVVSIPTTCTDVDRAAIVIETLNYEATEQLLPVYYDRVSYKGLRDEDSIDMLEIIRTTRYYNWGLAYDWLGSIEPSVHDMLLAGNGNVSSLATAAKKVVEKLIEKTMSGLK